MKTRRGSGNQDIRESEDQETFEDKETGRQGDKEKWHCCAETVLIPKSYKIVNKPGDN